MKYNQTAEKCNKQLINVNKQLMKCKQIVDKNVIIQLMKCKQHLR